MKAITILASASPRRRELLSQLGTDFQVIVANVDENVSGMPSPEAFVKELALRKARAVAGEPASRTVRAVPNSAANAVVAAVPCSPAASEQPGMVIIGADTVVVTEDGEILGKPADDGEAQRMLTKLSGKWHEVYTGVSLIVYNGVTRADNIRSDCVRKDLERAERAHAERTRVKMRLLDESAILRYIDTGEPRDKAGAYAIQGLGSVLIERVEGCFYNVVGLPLSALNTMLAEFGYSLL